MKEQGLYRGVFECFMGDVLRLKLHIIIVLAEYRSLNHFSVLRRFCCLIRRALMKCYVLAQFPLARFVITIQIFSDRLTAITQNNQRNGYLRNLHSKLGYHQSSVSLPQRTGCAGRSVHHKPSFPKVPSGVDGIF